MASFETRAQQKRCCVSSATNTPEFYQGGGSIEMFFLSKSHVEVPNCKINSLTSKTASLNSFYLSKNMEVQLRNLFNEIKVKTLSVSLSKVSYDF